MIRRKMIITFIPIAMFMGKMRMISFSNILIWIAVALIAGGLLNLYVRMLMALIQDEEWGILAIVIGATIGVIAFVLHQYGIASLGR